MSTRSAIGILHDDGSVESIYCHHDGYLSGVGATLNEHYASKESILDLMKHGDVRSLRNTVGETDFFPDCPSITYESLAWFWEEFSHSDQEYCYLYTKEMGWVYTTVKNPNEIREWNSVSDELALKKANNEIKRLKGTVKRLQSAVDFLLDGSDETTKDVLISDDGPLMPEDLSE